MLKEPDGRYKGRYNGKYAEATRTVVPHRADKNRVPPEQISGLRYNTPPATITAAAFGDPLPGQSALDKKRSGGTV